MTSAHTPILLVEDDDVDAMTVERAFQELNITNPLPRVTNGEEALDYLRNSKNDSPGLILLDMNMPRMNGLEFLQKRSQDEKLMMIPVVMLTTSKEDQDKLESFRLHVSGYMVKPVDYQQFVEVMKAIHVYWVSSEVPPSIPCLQE